MSDTQKKPWTEKAGITKSDSATINGDAIISATDAALYEFVPADQPASLWFILESIKRQTPLDEKQYAYLKAADKRFHQDAHRAHIQEAIPLLVYNFNALRHLITMDEIGAKCPESIEQTRESIRRNMLSIAFVGPLEGTPQALQGATLPKTPQDINAMLDTLTQSIRTAVQTAKNKGVENIERGGFFEID